MKNPFKSRFLRNVGKVAGGAAIGQVILVAASPFVTRIFGAETFGVWGVFNSIAVMIIPVASFSYVTAIVLPKDQSDARDIARISVLLTFIVAVFVTAAFIALGPRASDIFSGVGEAWKLFPLVGAFIFVGSCGEIARQILIRRERFSSLSVATTSTSVLTAIAQIVGGLVNPSPSMLVGSNAAAKSADAIVKLLFAGSAMKNISFRTSQLADYKRVAKEYRHFPFFKAPQTLIDGISQALPTIILGGYFGVASVGFYTICRTVLMMPGNLIGNAIADVFYPRVTYAFKSGDKIYPLVARATIMSFTVGALPFMVVILFGVPLFSFVFGQEWSASGAYAQWLVPWIWAMFANRPAVQAIQVLSLQRAHLRFTLSNVLLRLFVMMALSHFFGDALVAIAGYSIVACLLNLLLIGWVLARCRKHDKELEEV